MLLNLTEAWFVPFQTVKEINENLRGMNFFWYEYNSRRPNHGGKTLEDLRYFLSIKVVRPWAFLCYPL